MKIKERRGTRDEGREFSWRALSRIGLLALAILAVCDAARASIDDCLAATCRISDGQRPLGTGVCFEKAEGRVFVLTNAHVVEDRSTVHCEFWQDGHKSSPLVGRVVQKVRNDECDAAIVSLTEQDFGDRPPTAIPLAPADELIKPGQPLVSVGCAGGSWATAWKGHAKGYVGTDLRFTPPPAGGRSGSAIFDREGTRIVALLYARTGDDAEGMAISRQALARHLRIGTREGKWSVASGQWPESEVRTVWNSSLTTDHRPLTTPSTLTQCPDDYCPTPDRNINILGRQENYGSSPYPTLPPSPPERPMVSVAPVDADARAGLARLTVRVDALERGATGLASKGDLTAAANQLAQQTQTAVATAEEETGRLRGLIDQIKEVGVKQAVATALQGALASYGLPLGIAAALIIFLIRKDILDKVRTGDPLAIEKLAAKTPWKWDDRLASFVDSRVDAHADPNHGFREELADVREMVRSLRDTVSSKKAVVGDQ